MENSRSYFMALQKKGLMSKELISYVFCTELCWGKAMVGYTKPQQREKEEG